MNLYPPNCVIMAPLAGYTDVPYRRSMRRFGCRYAFTEMIDAASIAYGNVKTARLMERAPDEQWLGVQLVGSNPDAISRAIEVLNQRQYDVLDFNLGCPVPKVAKKGAGAALAKNIEQALRLFELIKKLSRFPVSAKIRIIHETDPCPTIELARGLADAGAAAVTVHGRIRSAFYSGPVFYDIIAAVREALQIQVIANGGVMGAASCRKLREETGCDCVMVARGAMGNPWLFRELSDPDSFLPPTPQELCDELEKHIREMIAYYGEQLALKIARKMILDYLKGRGFPGTIKSAVSHVSTSEQFCDRMKELRQGPSSGYRTWLKACPAADRQLRMD